MNVNSLSRRVHLYLGLALLPWFLMYALSAVPFAHPSLVRGISGDAKPRFTKRFDGPYTIDVPDSVDRLRPVGEKIVADLGLTGRLFHIGRPNPNKLTLYVYDFWNATQVNYLIPEHRLVAEDREFRWVNFLTGLHARGGFQQDSLMSDLWAVMVDVVCAGMVLWLATGLYMWWLLQQTRWWGSAAVVAGIAAAAVFVWGL